MATNTPAELAARLKELARSGLGAAAVGIAPASRPLRYEAFEAALQRGDQAGMAWLARPEARAARADPSLLLPGARSLICCAFRYHAPPPHVSRGQVARYARGADYHEVLPQLLEPLRLAVEASGGAARVLVDSAPLLEVAHAARAGLGWIGKHSLLLHRDHGSYLLLAEILTTLELPADQPVADHCGRCTACLEACPTGALSQPYRVEAARCLSYLTIEQRGHLPAPSREWFDHWLFGCDLCQEACPWTRRASALGHPALAPRADLAVIDPLELLGSADEVLRQRLAGTPLWRARRRGLRRTACLLLAQQPGPAADAALAAAATDPDEVVAAAAQWALAARARHAKAESGAADGNSGLHEV
ncbi:MAG: tRNA epoxyqueuosine(34) reductase QueG [Fimbriimonadaceae bacterium]|nr:tRNA epoxyqueuosine(34) reductase QueG [Fimbriimonadaceae bacterium]